MPTFFTSTYTPAPIHAVVKCDNGEQASLYFRAGDGPEVALVGIPSKVARAAAASFNEAMAEADAPILVAAQ